MQYSRRSQRKTRSSKKYIRRRNVRNANRRSVRKSVKRHNRRSRRKRRRQRQRGGDGDGSQEMSIEDINGILKGPDFHGENKDFEEMFNLEDLNKQNILRIMYNASNYSLFELHESIGLKSINDELQSFGSSLEAQIASYNKINGLETINGKQDGTLQKALENVSEKDAHFFDSNLFKATKQYFSQKIKEKGEKQNIKHKENDGEYSYTSESHPKDAQSLDSLKIIIHTMLDKINELINNPKKKTQPAEEEDEYEDEDEFGGFGGFGWG